MKIPRLKLSARELLAAYRRWFERKKAPEIFLQIDAGKRAEIKLDRICLCRSCPIFGICKPEDRNANRAR